MSCWRMCLGLRQQHETLRVLEPRDLHCSLWFGRGKWLSRTRRKMRTEAWWVNLRRLLIEKPRYKLKDNIKIAIQERGWYGMDFVNLAEEREKWWAVENTAANILFPKKCKEHLDYVRKCIFPKRNLLHAVTNIDSCSPNAYTTCSVHLYSVSSKFVPQWGHCYLRTEGRTH